jgi:hypothetical protein
MIRRTLSARSRFTPGEQRRMNSSSEIGGHLSVDGTFETLQLTVLQYENNHDD